MSNEKMLLEAVSNAENVLAVNLAWIRDQLDLQVRQKDPQAIARLGQLNQTWKELAIAKAKAERTA